MNPNGNRFVGNLIGTDVTGRQALGGQQIGVNLFYQPGNGDEAGPTGSVKASRGKRM